MPIDSQIRARVWLGAGAVHAAMSLAGFWSLSIVGLAAADSDLAMVPWWLAPLEHAVRFVLLQPLAHWVLALLEVRYWTWPGLALSTVLIGANSAVAIVVARTLTRLFSRR